MDQKKIGSFLKELRKEKGITQEEFAEKLNVSGRTVSRWETGANMPDISLLVEISEFFDISIPEIINGERKSETMNEEIKEVADKLSDYANAEKETIIKNIRIHSIMGTIALFVYCTLELSGAVLQNVIFEKIASYCETLALVTVLMIMLHVIFSTVALLDNNMVYVKEFYSYPFLYIFKNSRAACKCYDDMINKCFEYSHGKLSVFREINIHNNFVDMFRCKDNEYSCYEYWHRNFDKSK